MGREACCGREGLNRGAWTAEEDRILKDYVQTHGEGRWRTLPKKAGLKRCGKSCRLRWLNYLRPDIKIGNISEQEEDLIIRLHRLLGNRWSLIAGRLPGRTDNEVKNYWNTNLRMRVQGRSSSHSLQPKCNEHEEKLKAGAAPAATAAPPIHAEESLTIAEEVNNPPVEVPKPISSTAIERQETSTHEGCSSVDPQMESIWDFLLKGDARHESTCTDIIDDNSSLHCCHGELQLWDGMMRALESEGRTVTPSVAEQYSCGGNLHDWAALFEPIREDSALEVELFASSFGS